MKPGAKTLIVDDEPAAIQLLRKTLSGMGELRFATGGQEALALVAADPPDLILMDINMPLMDGYAAARHIRARDPRVPIIALTANAFQEDVERTRAAGMNAHLSKPIDAGQLMALLEQFLLTPANSI